MKSSASTNNLLLSVADYIGEPNERLAARALDGVVFGIAALKRLRHRLPKWLRPDGKIDTARAIAALAAVQTALALLSPVHLTQLAKRVRQGQLPRRKGA